MLVNADPLSDTSCSGIPSIAKMSHNLLMVTEEEVDASMCTSNLLECASIRSKNCFLRNGPARLMWTLAQGIFGYSHGCIEA